MEIRHSSPQADYRAALPRRWCKPCRISWMGAEPVTCRKCGQPSIPFGTDPYPPTVIVPRPVTPEEAAAGAQRTADLMAQLAEGIYPPRWRMMAKGASNRKPTREEIIRSGRRATKRTTPARPQIITQQPEAAPEQPTLI